MDNYIVWLFAAVLLFILEALTLGVFMLFFGFGALITSVVVFFFDFNSDYQIILFLVISVISLIGLRGVMKSILYAKSKGREVSENIEDVLGRHAEVVSSISQNNYGEVNLSGTKWYASAKEDITVGTHVKVVGRDNLILQVEKIKD